MSPRRLGALVRKETLQVVRDPSAILMAFVLPAILLFLFAYAVSLDVRNVRIGVVLEDDGAAARELAAAFAASRYFDVTPARHRREVEDLVVSGKLRGVVVIPQGFDRRLASPVPGAAPMIQVLTDGAQPNTASFVSGYADGVLATWLENRAGTRSGGARPGGTRPPRVVLEPRVWFNPEVESRKFLVPGSIAIIMTTIGTLLTALVVAREWERGTMEALFSTPAGIFEILLGKLLPYFALGLLATLGCGLLAVTVFGVPLRGSWLALMTLSASFLVPALGQGLLISALARNQFVAAQAAVFSGFLPAFLLSGFLFEIESMPLVIRLFTYVIPARYFVAGLQTVFVAGDVWAQFVPDVLAMLAIGSIFFAVTASRTRKSLDV
jgi:ABC-2 type transport system permease protein